MTDLESATRRSTRPRVSRSLQRRDLHPDRRRQRVRRRLEIGDVRWKYESNISQRIQTVCAAGSVVGVALGEGKVYIGQLDGQLVAVDQRTGQKVGETEVGKHTEGDTITAAPLYYDGMVIIGVSGGEFSIRGRVQAYDAETGEFV
jgi:quinohemoprotein ethanol dehydrogenase